MHDIAKFKNEIEYKIIFQDPTYRTSGIAETKRFLPPFHPLARFRGLSMHGGGGGIPSAYRPREDFETLVSSLPIQPNPAHPVPSGKSNISTCTL